METLLAGLEQHSSEIVKLLKKIDDKTTRTAKAGAVICSILDGALESNLNVLAALESAKLVLLSDRILAIGYTKMLRQEAEENE